MTNYRVTLSQNNYSIKKSGDKKYKVIEEPIQVYTPIEITEIYINNDCTDGSKRIVGCSTDNILILENLSIDAGFY